MVMVVMVITTMMVMVMVILSHLKTVGTSLLFSHFKSVSVERLSVRDRGLSWKLKGLSWKVQRLKLSTWKVERLKGLSWEAQRPWPMSETWPRPTLSLAFHEQAINMRLRATQKSCQDNDDVCHLDLTWLGRGWHPQKRLVATEASLTWCRHRD